MNIKFLKASVLAIMLLIVAILFLSSKIYQNNQYNKGLVWEIESKSGHKSIIFGTLHLADSDLDLVFQNIEPYLEKARKIFVEYIPKHIQAPISESHSTKYLLEKIEYNQLLDLSNNLNIPNVYIDHSTPCQAYFLLSNPKILKEPHIDHRILIYATTRNLPIAGLETEEAGQTILNGIEETICLKLIKDALSDPEQISYFVSEIKRLYLAQDLNGLLNSLYLTKLDHTVINNFNTLMLTERNKGMLQNAIEDLEVGNIFIAVGAAHLPGPDGMLNQLKSNGFKITNINFLS